MSGFEAILEKAADHKGGLDAVEKLLGPPKDDSQLAALSDDRLLAIFSRYIFSTGLSWKVIENKWPGFEVAFDGFDPNRLAFRPDEDYEALLSDTRIVRHGAKIMSVRDNAIWFTQLARDHGSAAAFFANWPQSDQIGLMEKMKKEGSRLGGTTGPYALRTAGKDCFIVTKDVSVALVREGIVDKPPTSKSALAAVQKAFNHWHEETGRCYSHLSRILAMSVG